MAYKRIQVGSVLKAKDPTQQDYIKIDNDVTLKKGDILNLESKKSRLAQLEKNVENGKVDPSVADKIREGIEKTPDFIRFSIVKVTKE